MENEPARGGIIVEGAGDKQRAKSRTIPPRLLEKTYCLVH